MSQTTKPRVPGIFTQIIQGDGELKLSRVVEGHLLVCKGCCCGNTERGKPSVPIDRFKKEWRDRDIWPRLHLTIAGCLGPCAVANVVLLMYQGTTVWFHSINSDDDVVRIYQYVDHLLAIGRFAVPTGSLAQKVFQRYTTDALCAFNGSSSCEEI